MKTLYVLSPVLPWYPLEAEHQVAGEEEPGLCVRVDHSSKKDEIFSCGKRRQNSIFDPPP